MATVMMESLVAHRRGGSEMLGLDRVPRPQPRPNEILIQVHAAGITFAELDWEETWTRDGLPRFPVIPAHEFSGVVAQTGAGVTGFRAGDGVFGLVPFDENGAAAAFVRVPTESVAPKPVAMTHVAAAALPLAALTAHQALYDHGHLQPNQRVLVQGGAGSVGAMTVQLAAALGADVTATARASEHSFVRSLGAHSVVEVGETERLTAGGFDLIIDCIGGEVPIASLPLVRSGGRLVALTSPIGDNDRRDVQQIFFVVVPQATVLTELAAQVASGLLRVRVSATFPIESGRDAYASGRHSRKSGKTVIVVNATESH